MIDHLGASKFIDDLCQELETTELRPKYNEEKDLKFEVGDVLKNYTKAKLGQLASVYVEDKDKGKIKSIWAFGTDFWPDITIDVRGLPTVAIEVKLRTQGISLASACRDLIGQSIIYSLQYPFVIGFLWNQESPGDEKRHWFDEEVKNLLWKHGIRMIVRPLDSQ